MVDKPTEIYSTLMVKASGFLPLKEIVQKIWIQANSELEFQFALKKKMNEFKQYSTSNIDLLNDEIRVDIANFVTFSNVVKDITKELIQFESEVKWGQITSEKNGIKYNFVYEYYRSFFENSPVYVFKIFEKGREGEDYFSYQLREMENGSDLKVIDLYPDISRYYLGKGISIAIILESKNIFKKRIISSSNSPNARSSEWNSEEAIEKVWSKLVTMRLAEYNEELDYYFTK